MYMTNEEIVRHFRQAAIPANDIQVLADLNDTDKESIIAVLVAAGAISDAKKRPTLTSKVLPLIAQGLSNREIAERVGCRCKQVAGVRQRRKAKRETHADLGLQGGAL